MTAECAVCYVSDINFLLPSIVSATGVRKFVPPHKADIFVFTAGVDRSDIEEIDRFMRPYSIRVQAMDENLFSNIDRSKFIKKETPMAMFGRFFLDHHLPSSCRRIVYIDGDTWIARDPTPLIEAIVPDGLFAAAEDTIFYRQNFGFGATVRMTRHYFQRLGLDPKNGYFNSGVFAVSRSTWKSIAQEAFSFYVNNADICQYNQDQCALNAVAGSRRLRLSNKWNFQTQLKIWGADRYIEPHIYHFNRWPKPWMGACDPWREIYSPYQLAAAAFSSLDLPLNKLTAEQEEDINAGLKKTYSYLQMSLVSKLALAWMGFQNIEKYSWLR